MIKIYKMQCNAMKGYLILKHKNALEILGSIDKNRKDQAERHQANGAEKINENAEEGFIFPSKLHTVAMIPLPIS